MILVVYLLCYVGYKNFNIYSKSQLRNILLHSYLPNKKINLKLTVVFTPSFYLSSKMWQWQIHQSWFKFVAGSSFLTEKKLNHQSWFLYYPEEGNKRGAPTQLLRGVEFGIETKALLFKRLCSYAGLHCEVRRLRTIILQNWLGPQPVWPDWPIYWTLGNCSKPLGNN